jgi:hypothetical protein
MEKTKKALVSMFQLVFIMCVCWQPLLGLPIVKGEKLWKVFHLVAHFEERSSGVSLNI